MAWIFSMCVHGPDAAAADRLVEHFDGLQWTRSDGVATRCDVQRLGLRGCWIVPSGLSRAGLVSEACGREFAEAAEHLYRRLETAPEFALALVGVEVDDERDDVEIRTICAADDEAWRGAVAPEALWREAGQPGAFEPFAAGYRWRPYEPIDARVFKAPVGSHCLVPGTRVVDRPGWYQVFAETPGLSGNEVVISELDEGVDVGACFDRVTSEFAARQTPFKWCVGPTTRPADMPQRLVERGFSHWGMRGMFWRLDAALPELADGVSVERVGVEDLDVVTATMCAAWSMGPGDGEVWRARYRWGFEHPGDRYRYYLARLNGRPVGTAATLVAGGLGYLLGGAVDPAVRGRGVYRMLVRARLAELHSGGIRLAVTHAREATSAPILERLGFETAYRRQCYCWPAS